MFPDEFHLYTLNVFLKSCCELQPSVNVKTIVILMINRLTIFTFQNSNASEVKLFEVLTEQIANIIQVICLLGLNLVIFTYYPIKY